MKQDQALAPLVKHINYCVTSFQTTKLAREKYLYTKTKTTTSAICQISNPGTINNVFYERGL